ncbi:MAG TPA: asparagine synthase (glutamine-hydrolyzing) [Nitrospirales bacterium]|jgi:asparagine synthase (glutamine-hydrolysing)
MCGIAGALQLGVNEEEWQSHLTSMSRVLVHRGPDEGGMWFDVPTGIGFAHRRLSIIDLSPAGNQPMQSACGRYVVTYNGEIYNFRLLRLELEGLGQKFRGHSDTEVLLAAVSQWGLEKAVDRFNGMFAFALWDREAQSLHLCRDRIGEKPLYYGWMGRTFLFASELKALLTHPACKSEVDRNALALYLRHSYIPTPYSVYKGISKLPAGTMLTITARGPHIEPTPVAYWSAKEVAERGVLDMFAGSEEDAAVQLDALLMDAVKLRMVSDVPLGAFLSGGIDSSTVVALMQAQSAQPVKTFSIGFHEDSYNEAVDAKAVARHLGTEHTELYVTSEEARAVIPYLPQLYDEPFSDCSQIGTFLVSKLARRQVTVALSGDGGDELFAGYNRYFWAESIWNRMNRLPMAVRNAAAAALTFMSADTWNTGFDVVRAMLPRAFRVQQAGDKLHKLAGVLSAEDQAALYRQLVSHWTIPAAVVLGASEPMTILSDRTRWSHLEDFRQQMMFVDTVTYLPDDILVKVDRASMGVGLEARVPLLDHRVLEFAWRVPISMNIQGRTGKRLLRKVLDKHVPLKLVDRPKMGFSIPIDSWLRGPLRDWAEDLLDEGRLNKQGFFSPRPIRQKWLEHLSGRRNWQYHLWDILMFQAWLNEYRHA